MVNLFPLDKMAAISQMIFHMHFREWKVVYLIENNGQHAIIWTKADQIRWRIYAAPGGDELMRLRLRYM